MWNRSSALPLAMFVALSLPAAAAAQAGSATAYVQRRNGEVDALMERPAATDAARTARDARVGAIIDQLIDYDALSRATLSTDWSARTAAEQQEFVALYTLNIQRGYLASLERIRDYRVTYLAEEVTPEGTVVHATAQSRASRREPSIEIDYVMRSVDGGWRVVDIVTAGSNFARTQGSAFRRIIAEHGWAELLTRMRARIATPAG